MRTFLFPSGEKTLRTLHQNEKRTGRATAQGRREFLPVRLKDVGSIPITGGKCDFMSVPLSRSRSQTPHTHTQQTLPTSSNDKSSQVIKNYLLSTCFGVGVGLGTVQDMVPALGRLTV